MSGTVSSFNPARPEPTQPVVFTIGAGGGALISSVSVSILLPGMESPEVVYASGAFTGEYSGYSATWGTSSSKGFSILRQHGWMSSPLIYVQVTYDDGLVLQSSNDGSSSSVPSGTGVPGGGSADEVLTGDMVWTALADVAIPPPVTPPSENDFLSFQGGAWSRFASTSLGRVLLAVVGAMATREAIGIPEERRVIPLCEYATNDGALTAYGRVCIDPTDYAVVGRTLTATLETLAEVSTGGLSLEVTLVDLTHANAVVAIITETATTTTRQTAVLTLNVAASIYELRATLTGVGYAGFSTNLILTWSTP